MLNQVTLSRLDELGLRGMAQALTLQWDHPEVSRMAFEERLGLLLDAEMTLRENRRIERLLKMAKLRETTACLEDLDFRPERHLDRSVINTLTDCNWMRRRQSLMLTGPTGSGKSWLACAFGKQACRNGISTYYTTATQFFEDLQRAQLEGSLPKLRGMLVRTVLLIIDDLGIGGISVELGPVLLDIIDRHAAQGALIVTSQFPCKKWYDLFNDPTVADAILDRIVHRAHFIDLKGESMRKLRGKNT